MIGPSKKVGRCIWSVVPCKITVRENNIYIQQGSHFVRCGVHGLGSELQRRGISCQRQWGARGIVLVCLFRGIKFLIMECVQGFTVL